MDVIVRGGYPINSCAGRHHLQDFWQAAKPVLGFCLQLLGGRSLQQRLRTLVLKLLLRREFVDAKLRNRAEPSFSDNSAWLVGLKFGENKKAGDFLVSADYRQVGISSIDPNLNSSNFALSNLNSHGWEFNLAYNFTDFLTSVFTLYYSHALHPNLYGGYATGNVRGIWLAVGHQHVFSAIGRLVVKIFAGCYFPLVSGKMTR